MIYCTNKIYGKVWKVTKAEKYLDLQITTSEKDQDGSYINSGWFPRCIGHAFNTLKDTIKEGDRISITKSKFTNERYTAKDGTVKSAFKFLILDAAIEPPIGGSSTVQAESQAAAEPEAPANTDECPW